MLLITITITNTITITGGPRRRTEEGPGAYFPLFWFSQSLLWGAPPNYSDVRIRPIPTDFRCLYQFPMLFMCPTYLLLSGLYPKNLKASPQKPIGICGHRL